MDEVTRSHYAQETRSALLEKKGQAFQDFFSDVMEKRYPADFQRIRPWGNIGDWKNDGYIRSSKTLFQLYAPNEVVAAETIKKINEDFAGALEHWNEYLSGWTFVHNSHEGLGPQVLEALLKLEKANPGKTIKTWGPSELRNEIAQLGEADLQALFGLAPSRRGLLDLRQQDVAPILDQIAKLSPTAEPDLRPVPADKLQKNLLSDHVKTLLTAGMTRSDLVGKYFEVQPLVQDKVAAAFNTRYLELKSAGHAPDDIFYELQVFTAGERLQKPETANGVLAVLAFLFENCDIFERPGEAAT